ncbi:MAG: type II toxin-antitoxin system HicA family toxin [Endomicrobium sp.]|jgi:predicted RNA binding protein YcfA (HicA-like mRNA interferase family)|nr:type II toxin-antitoxin system HicA family toxin [Endomicrobium sp.]
MSIGTIKQSRLIKFIEANGFYKRRQSGSHATYRNDVLNITIVIPVGRKDTLDYLITDVRKALGLSKDEFERSIKNF